MGEADKMLFSGKRHRKTQGTRTGSNCVNKALQGISVIRKRKTFPKT